MDTEHTGFAEHHIRAALADAKNSFAAALAGTKVDAIALKNAHAQFVISVLLEELRRRAPERADTMTSWITQAMEDGDVAPELVWQWLDQVDAGHVPTGWLFDVADQPKMPNTWTFDRPVRTATGETRVQVAAAFTATSGLMVAQVAYIDDGEPTIFDGRWDVLHTRSGLAVTSEPRGWPFEVAQSIAAELGQLGIDWYERYVVIRTLPERDPDTFAKIQPVIDAQRAHRHCTDADHAAPAWRTAPVPATAGAEQ